MTELRLRDYQREAIDAVFAAWAGGMQRPAIVLPTGAGKTVVFASLIKEFRASAASETDRLVGGQRVIVLAHRDELVDQAIAKIRAIAPDLNVGKVKAESNDVGADVMVCSVQSLASARRLAPIVDGERYVGNVGLIITDECHHAAAASYQKIYDAFPDALQLGVTATMARGDGRGLGSVWDDVVYQRSILWMISKGYLTDVRTKRVELKNLDMGEVKLSRGDWQAGDLGRALMEAEADTAIARAYKEHAGARQGIVFTPTVGTAFAACDALVGSGIRADVVHGETPRDLRREVYENFRKGDVQVLVNCMVLTEGFDAPWAEVAMIARPTRSETLYAQMVGRVLRPWAGKTEALVLDLVGASANKLRTLIDLDPDGPQKIRDGESLAEAAVREEEEGNRIIPGGSIAFDLKAREVSSFEASDHAWGRTERGVMFVATGQGYVFLWPAADSPGLWDVCTAVKGQKWHRTQYTGLDIGMATAWGEAVAEDVEETGDGAFGFNNRRSAKWRRGEPTPAQVKYARSLRIPGAEEMNRGEVAASIDRAMASRIFDRYVKG